MIMAADLYRIASTAMSRAYAPYSGLRVGAAICTSDGRTYSGCNIENVAYPEGWCAETTAIAHMVMDGGGTIAEIAVIADRLPLATPCGGCRQRIAEFGTPRTRIYLCDNTGISETILLDELLPKAFRMDDL
jgi:cytidine deaminase